MVFMETITVKTKDRSEEHITFDQLRQRCIDEFNEKYPRAQVVHITETSCNRPAQPKEGDLRWYDEKVLTMVFYICDTKINDLIDRLTKYMKEAYKYDQS